MIEILPKVSGDHLQSRRWQPVKNSCFTSRGLTLKDGRWHKRNTSVEDKVEGVLLDTGEDAGGGCGDPIARIPPEYLPCESKRDWK